MLINQHLNGLEYNIFIPESGINKQVDMFVNITSSPQFSTERILPTIKSEILFTLADKLKSNPHKKNKKQVTKQVSESNDSINSYDSAPCSIFNIVAIGLNQEWLGQMQNTCPKETTNEHNGAGVCLPSMNETLHRYLESVIVTDKFAILENCIGKTLSVMNDSENELALWIKNEIECNNTIKVSDLESKSGYSRKHLFTTFKKQYKINVKTFQEIVRFLKIVIALQSRNESSLSELAYELEFFDQSHFIKLFKKYSGLTPSQFMKNHIYVEQSIPFFAK